MSSLIQLNRGRPKKPTEQKELAGTLRPSRENASEPRLQWCAVPPPPDAWPEDHRAAWIKLAAIVDSMRVYTSADLIAFELLTQSYVIVMEAERSLRSAKLNPAKSLLYVEDGAKLKRRPELAIIGEHHKLLLLHLSRFGMTPADRSRVSALAADEPEHDPLAEFTE